MRRDVIVVGAGVAGSVAAKRLRSLGASVALIGGASAAGVEGLSERSVRLLAEEGVESELAPAPRGGAWGARRIEGREWLIEREWLATTLRRTANLAGVENHEGMARRFERQQGLWRVTTDSGVLSAPWLIDARGRRGPAASGPKLLAVAFSCRTRRTAAPATRIEPFSSGWCWWARRENSLFVQIIRRPRSAPPHAWLGAAAGELPQLQAALEAGGGNLRVSARPAHARRAPECAHESLWRAGDAAWAPDPLSGQGVYEALRSGKLIATALISVLNGGELDVARRFVAEHQMHAFKRALRMAGDFYRENAGRGLFWREVAAEYAGFAGETPRISPHIESKPVLLNGRIVLRDVLVTDEYPRGVLQVGGVPVAPLFAAMKSPPALREASSPDQPPAALEAARHWLKHQVEPRIIAGPAFHEEFIRADS